jgi:hypothetical protein
VPELIGGASDLGWGATASVTSFATSAVALVGGDVVPGRSSRPYDRAVEPADLRPCPVVGVLGERVAVGQRLVYLDAESGAVI